ncbi:MAG TPA: hypothetical protein PLX35_14840 [Cyclobacteriaceae bacterium]|nr:hypothetical protein [Cyclobacteriaceae bacterium]
MCRIAFMAQPSIQLVGILIILTLLMGSCRKVLFYKGRHKIISRETDTSLADSVMIFGKVVSVLDTLSPRPDARVWTTELTLSARADNRGLYSLKLPKGTYTLNCQGELGTNEFIESTKGISFLPDEKVEIYFYVGGKVE